MPRGRKPLDPEEKRIRRQQTRRGYAERNADLLKQAARERMRRRREALTTAPWKEQRAYKDRACKASAAYRDRKEHEFRTDMAERRTLDVEEREQRDKKAKSAVRKDPPPPPRTPPPPRKRPASALLNDEGVSGDEDASDPRAAALRAPPPQYRGFAQMDFLYQFSGISGGINPVGTLTCVLLRLSLCLFLLTSLSLLPPSTMPGVNSTQKLPYPAYRPDRGHEDIAQHSAAHDLAFHGVLNGPKAGFVFSSRTTLEHELADDPEARSIIAPTWERLLTMWMGCGVGGKPVEFMPGPPTSAPTWKARTWMSRAITKSSAAPVLCDPVFLPEFHHEDYNVHDAHPHRLYYAFPNGNFVGAVSSHQAVVEILPGQVNEEDRIVISASDWNRLVDLWHAKCREFHDHHGDDVVRNVTAWPTPPTLPALSTPGERLREVKRAYNARPSGRTTQWSRGVDVAAHVFKAAGTSKARNALVRALALQAPGRLPDMLYCADRARMSEADADARCLHREAVAVAQSGVERAAMGGGFQAMAHAASCVRPRRTSSDTYNDSGEGVERGWHTVGDYEAGGEHEMPDHTYPDDYPERLWPGVDTPPGPRAFQIVRRADGGNEIVRRAASAAPDAPRSEEIPQDEPYQPISISSDSDDDDDKFPPLE
ncbi:hypothetical protein DFH09DRAFT_1102391 [Mycena vulgaris]|nr:hypothetical protein DFH09DRAFT_1102391 [Mycena vulgaris]